MIRVLIVDDSALMRRFLARIFEAEADFEVQTARDGVEALRRIDEFNPDVVTLDIEMPNMNGLACLDRIMVEHPRPVVMVSSLTEDNAGETLRALEMGAIDFIPKPDGTISLHADDLAPLVLERVRSAAGVRIKRSARLVERVRFRSVAAAEPRRPRREVPAGSPGTKEISDDALVLVGASTGGPPALDRFLSAIPADFGWPILIAQHMPGAFTTSFARRLDGLCALDVIEVVRPVAIEPGTVYVGQGDADLIISRRAGRLVALSAPADPHYRWHPSVDRLVESAMEHQPADGLVGILMTGMGNDGAESLTELQRAGGHVMAEAEETAVVWGMPGDLVRRNGTDDVLPLPKIAPRLVEISPWR